MDYVDWVGCVFAAVEEARKAADSGSRREPFLRLPNICRFLGFESEAALPSFDETEPASAAIDALVDLETMGLVKHVEYPLTYQMTVVGRKISRRGLPATWPSIFARSRDLDDEQLLVLSKAVEMAQERHEGYVCMRKVPLVQIQDALGIDWVGPHGRSKALYIYKDLTNLKLMKGRGGMGGQTLRPIYNGMVLITRRIATEQQVLIRNLLPDWESTNVDFKRELNLGRDKEKAEFVRDVLALANTKSPGRRFLVVGFGPTSRAFEKSVDPAINQDQLENILNVNATPAPRVIYARVPWESGHLGLIEVIREPQHLPYNAKRNLAHLQTGNVYVRHSSHTETASAEELKSLEAEGQRARERHQ